MPFLMLAVYYLFLERTDFFAVCGQRIVSLLPNFISVFGSSFTGEIMPIAAVHHKKKKKKVQLGTFPPATDTYLCIVSRATL